MEGGTKSLMRRMTDSQWVRLAFYLLLFLPLLLRREPTPANELKYLQIADEALRNGHFWCLYLDGAAYADKPPLYFWIVMLFRKLLGFHCIPLLELFSLLPAFGILVLFDRWCGARLARWRIVAEMALLTTAYFLGGAVVLRMDMLMCFFITLAMWLFWRMDRGDRSTGLPWCFALAVFGAIFTKGPVGFLFPLLGCFAWLLSERRLRTFGRAWGWRTWLVLVVLCGIWWGFVYLEGGRDYIDNLLVHQTVGRAVDAFHHKRPVYWYLVVVWYAMGPWSLLTVPVGVRGAVRHRLQPTERFFLLISAAFFVLMSLFSSKLQIYLLPMFGFVNYACFLILAAREPEMPRQGRRIRGVCYFVAGLMLAGVLVAGIFFPDIF